MASSLWAAEGLTLSVGRQVIFDNADFYIGENERVALIGRNGTGKSTLLKIAANLEQPSSGSIAIRKDLYVATMPQEFEQGNNRLCGDVLREGAKRFEEMLRRYDSLPVTSLEHTALENQLNLHDGWNWENKLDILRDKLDLPPDDKPFEILSGGEQRRLLLARAIASSPDLLLLDEPTNHLDIISVSKIENFLASYQGACLFITHDRYFLDRVATRIVELENGKFFSCEGSYADFLEAKEAAVYAMDAQTAKREKFLRREIEWVRRSPKARLKRNLGRVKRYEELAAIKDPEKASDMELIIPPPSRLGNKVVNLINVSKSYGDRKILDNFSYEFTPNCKVGIVGSNGCGKSTLLKIMTGVLACDSGKVEKADTVKFNYIEQNRVRLNPLNTVVEEIGEGCEFLYFEDGSKISVRTYLKRFLFEDERINSKIEYLSGGERARLTLAKMIKEGGNFLILDEPTNDLDLSSLRVLEESLASYPSSLVVVSHDRYFLNRVCQEIIGFDEETGKITCLPGDYSYYLEKSAQLKKQNSTAVEENQPKAKNNNVQVTQRVIKNPKTLSYKEEKELEGMEENILIAEEEVASLEAIFADPDFYSKHGNNTAKLKEDLDAAKAKVEELYQRWEFLEQKKKGQL